MREIRVEVPGEPYALKRPRAYARGGHARMYDPKDNRSWKAYAAKFFQDAVGEAGPLEGPVPVLERLIGLEPTTATLAR